MIRDGNGAVTGTVVRDFYGGRDRYIRGTDDLLILPLQSGTQWDALAHIIFDGKIYNGYDATDPSGARAPSSTTSRSRATGSSAAASSSTCRAPWAVPGSSPASQIHAEDLEACAARAGRRRSGVATSSSSAPARWRSAATPERGAPMPADRRPVSPSTRATWIFDREIAAVATDTWGMEVLPNETPDVFQPLHIILLVHIGLMVGEIFELEALADDCAADGQYEFLFSAPPLPITGGVGSPVNPIAIK